MDMTPALLSIFGPQILHQACTVPLDRLECNPSDVADAAIRLGELGAAMRPADQTAFASTLAPGTATALCMWGMDVTVFRRLLLANGVPLH